jgi:transcriptional regulator
MYLPRHFRESNLDVLHAFVRRHVFATVISHAGELHVSHLPLLLDPGRGANGTLVGHLARANQQWRDFDGERPALCIFHGPHAYISPSWYRSHPAVPTWNYAVVHVTGRPRALEAPDAVGEIVDRLVATFDPAVAASDQDRHSPEARQGLLKQIVGLEIPIETIDGKFKLGQNRSRDDRMGAIDNLTRQGDSADLIELMRAIDGGRAADEQG